jgi:hypothetical protein
VALGTSSLTTCEAVLDNVAKGLFQIPLELSRSASEVRRLRHKYRVHRADFEVYRWGGNNRFRLFVRLD